MLAVIKYKKALSFGLWLLIPAVVVLGTLLFREKYYAWMALCVAVLACLPLFYSFEHKNNSAAELTVLAVLVALSAMGRFVFAWLPGFHPVTAITVIVAIHFGREAGFALGALSALVSNFYFGQGPWTPFQMFSWGGIGLLAALVARPLKNSRVLLCGFGALAGVLYSALMDIWTVLWADGGWNLARYVAAVATALPTTVAYILSNVLFLLLMARPMGDKLERLQQKFGLFKTPAALDKNL